MNKKIYERMGVLGVLYVQVLNKAARYNGGQHSIFVMSEE